LNGGLEFCGLIGALAYALEGHHQKKKVRALLDPFVEGQERFQAHRRDRGWNWMPANRGVLGFVHARFNSKVTDA
jgi:hypothetical protein